MIDRAARDVAPGSRWAWLDHRTMGEVIAGEEQAMNSRDLASIASNVAALVKRAHGRGDNRLISVIADEILAASGFDEIDGRQQITTLKRRGSLARRAARAMFPGKHLLPPA